MPDAPKHLLPESRKPSGKQRRYCLTRSTFWGNQLFFFLGKKITLVKHLWTTNEAFVPLYLKVDFLRMGDSNTLNDDHLPAEDLAGTPSLFLVHLF